ncbi:hypothetical protein G9A89_019296 [Geosiphon pyriformis]|nr:hypothetical protein G9A89_019296 [Geosiphon pyriformis]
MELAIPLISPAVQIIGDNLKINSVIGGSTTFRKREFATNRHLQYSRKETKNLCETLATYFQELNYNIIKYCEEKYPVQSKYSLNFKLETETRNKGKQKVKQYSRTTSNTPILPKTTAKHLQTSKQGTSVKLPLFITPFPISLVQSQTPNSPLNCFSRPEDFQSPRNPTQQQEPILTSANIIDYLQENKSNHSESLKSKKTELEPEEATKNEEEMTTAYIAKIPEFTGKDNDTSLQEWLDKVQKAEDANGWNAARMLKAIPYFLQGTVGKWFENLKEPFENWQAFKDAFLQQFTDNNTSITLRNCFHNIKQETSETVMTYLGRFNKLLRQIRQLETNNYYFDAQILDKFIAELKDKLIKKVHLHAPADLATAIRHVKSYEMAIEKANHTKFSNNNRINPNNQLVPQNSGQQKPNHYHTQPSYLTIPEESDFQQTALSEGKVAAPKSNPSNHTIPPAQIAQNANLSDIFPFEFEVNESPFLLSNAAVNEQKTITAIYTEAIVEEKPIRLILDSGSAGSIITYQLMEQLK